MFPSICQCGSQSGYPHSEDCPYPYFFDDEKGVAKWNAAHENKVFTMKYGLDPETVRFARENEFWDLVDEQGKPVELPANKACSGLAETSAENDDDEGDGIGFAEVHGW